MKVFMIPSPDPREDFQEDQDQLHINPDEILTTGQPSTLGNPFQPGPSLDTNPGCGGLEADTVMTYSCNKGSYTSQDQMDHDRCHMSVSKPVQAQQLPKSGQDSEESPLNGFLTNIQSNEGLQDVFLCKPCKMLIPSGEECSKHMSTVHKLTQFDSEFIRNRIILNPEEVVVQGLPPPSDTGPPRTRSRGARPSKYPCSVCKNVFKSEEASKTHEKCHSADGSGFRCFICDPLKANVKAYPTWATCSTHLWRVHDIDVELLTCPVCQKYKAPNQTKLQKHIRNQCTRHKCGICHREFKQLKQLKTHEKFHRENKTKLPPPEDSRWYTPKECHVCSRILADAKCLKKHISVVHDKVKNFTCEICSHSCARKAELQLHLRQHTGVKPFKCDVCSFATVDHNSLRNHKLRHTDSRPYLCPKPGCKYSCIQSSAFKKHILGQHPEQGKILFICGECPLVTVNESSFLAHQKDHKEGRIVQAETTKKSKEKSGKSGQDGGITGESLEVESIEIEAQSEEIVEDITDIPEPADQNSSNLSFDIPTLTLV